MRAYLTLVSAPISSFFLAFADSGTNTSPDALSENKDVSTIGGRDAPWQKKRLPAAMAIDE